MTAPTSDYLAYFAFKKPNSTPEKPVLEYPIGVEAAMLRTNISNANLLIITPPDNWVPVYRSQPPALTAYQELVEQQPVYNTELKKWVQSFILRDMTTEQIQAMVVSARRTKELEINASRMAANENFFYHRGKKFAADALSMKDIFGVNGIVARTNALPSPWVGAWKAKDNSYVPITKVEEWDAFFYSIYLQGVMNFQHSETLKALLATKTSIDDISAISWNGTDTGFSHS